MLCASKLALRPSVAKLRRITAYTENGIDCPTIILTGSEEGTHRPAFALIARIPNCDSKSPDFNLKKPGLSVFCGNKSER